MFYACFSRFGAMCVFSKFGGNFHRHYAKSRALLKRWQIGHFAMFELFKHVVKFSPVKVWSLKTSVEHLWAAKLRATRVSANFTDCL